MNIFSRADERPVKTVSVTDAESTISSTTAQTAPRSPQRTSTSTLISPKSTANAAAEAHYAKQRRYGVFTGPGAPVVGVPQRSSDTAAVLASQSDLSLKLWHRESVSPRATSAAQLATTSDSSPEIWQPSPSASAGTAALLAKDRHLSNEKIRNEPSIVARTKAATASRAALSAHEVPAHVQAAQALPDAYSWSRGNSQPDVVRSASMKVLSKDPKSAAADAALAGSDGLRRASSIGAGGFNGAYGSAAELDLSKVESVARANAEQRLSKLYLASDSNNVLKFSATGAAASHQALPATQQEYESRYLKERDHFLKDAAKNHLKIMELARERTSQNLSKIDQRVTERNPLHNSAQISAVALQIAEKNSSVRMETHGKIDIGGGKFMTQSEVEAIAQRNVKPVLDEIAEVAAKQRQEDEERRQAEEEAREKAAEERRYQQELRNEDKRIRNEEKARDKIARDKKRAEEKEVRSKEKAARKEREAELKAQRLEREAELKHERLERQTELKAEKRTIRDRLRLKQIKLRGALDEAKKAEEIAQAEVTKLAALKEAAQAQLDQATHLEEEEEAKEGSGNEELLAAARAVRENRLADLKAAEENLAAAEQRLKELQEETMQTANEKGVVDEDEKRADEEVEAAETPAVAEEAEAEGSEKAEPDVEKTAVGSDDEPESSNSQDARNAEAAAILAAAFRKPEQTEKTGDAEEPEPETEAPDSKVSPTSTAAVIAPVIAAAPVVASLETRDKGKDKVNGSKTEKADAADKVEETTESTPAPVVATIAEVEQAEEKPVEAEKESKVDAVAESKAEPVAEVKPTKSEELGDAKDEVTTSAKAEAESEVPEDNVEIREIESTPASAPTSTAAPVTAAPASDLEEEPVIIGTPVGAPATKAVAAPAAPAVPTIAPAKSESKSEKSERSESSPKRLLKSLRDKLSSKDSGSGSGSGSGAPVLPKVTTKTTKQPLPTASDNTTGLANVAAKAATGTEKAANDVVSKAKAAKGAIVDKDEDKDVDLTRTFSGFSDQDDSALAEPLKTEGVFQEQI